MKKKSFTLAELLIVIVIIGILATFVVLALNNNAKTARDARAKKSLNTVRDSIIQYAAANYPVIFNSSAVFGNAVVDITTTAPINDKLRSGGAAAFSTDPIDAKGNPIKAKFSDYGYLLEAKTSAYSNTRKVCWYVIQRNYKLPENTETNDNLSDKSSTYTCTLY